MAKEAKTFKLPPEKPLNSDYDVTVREDGIGTYAVAGSAMC